MKTIEQQMAVYQAYHRHPHNRLTHFFGVPLIIYALLVALAMPSFEIAGLSLSVAHVFVAVVLAYYFVLDFALAVAMVCFIVPVLWLAIRTADAGSAVAWSVFAATFVGGWILQLVGHKIEGRRPALVDNFFQIFVAPIFLMAEVFFMLGFRREIREKVERLAAEPRG